MINSFLIFESQNPDIYRYFVRFTFEVIKTGRTNYSVNAIFERIRWHTEIETRGSDFKLNNNYRAYYARMFMHEYPTFSGFFNTRTMKDEQRLTEWLQSIFTEEAA